MLPRNPRRRWRHAWIVFENEVGQALRPPKARPAFDVSANKASGSALNHPVVPGDGTHR
jgi:hypothetical protein